MEVRLAMGTFAVANGALVSSIFGMNLWTGWESSGAAFVGVSAVALGVSASVFSVLRRRLGALVRR